MNHPATAAQARITEIFSSIQGEGPRWGERHLFIRFEECHMHCEYCDELHKTGRDWTLEEVMTSVRELEAAEGPHDFISLTGGEPLLYLPFLKPLMLRLKEQGFKIYLETSGVLWRSLAEVMEWCDCISMDLKTSSVTKEKNFDTDHKEFLRIARQKETFVKIVVSKEIDIEELREEFELIREIAPHTPVVLMPISKEIEGHEDGELMGLMQELQALGKQTLPDVRILPRFHKILNVR